MKTLKPYLTIQPDDAASTFILGKDLPLEHTTIANMTSILAYLGMKIRKCHHGAILCQMFGRYIFVMPLLWCFTNGKGATKESALCSALGEFIERLNCNFFL